MTPPAAPDRTQATLIEDEMRVSCLDQPIGALALALLAGAALLLIGCVTSESNASIVGAPESGFTGGGAAPWQIVTVGIAVEPDRSTSLEIEVLTLGSPEGGATEGLLWPELAARASHQAWRVDQFVGFRSKIELSHIDELTAALAEIGLHDLSVGGIQIERATTLLKLGNEWRFDAVIPGLPRAIEERLARYATPGTRVRYEIHVRMPGLIKEKRQNADWHDGRRAIWGIDLYDGRTTTLRARSY